MQSSNNVKTTPNSGATKTREELHRAHWPLFVSSWLRGVRQGSNTAVFSCWENAPQIGLFWCVLSMHFHVGSPSPSCVHTHYRWNCLFLVCLFHQPLVAPLWQEPHLAYSSTFPTIMPGAYTCPINICRTNKLQSYIFTIHLFLGYLLHPRNLFFFGASVPSWFNYCGFRV